MKHLATATSTAAFRLSQADIGVLTPTDPAVVSDVSGRRPLHRRRLHRLAEAGLLLRLRALPVPRFGSAPQVFTLARSGYAILSGLGIAAPAYFRPAEEQKKAENFPFMQHTLAVVDTLITMERACRSQGFTIPRLLTERELKREPVRVAVPP